MGPKAAPQGDGEGEFAGFVIHARRPNFEEGFNKYQSLDTTVVGLANILELLRWAWASSLFGKVFDPAYVAVAFFVSLQITHRVEGDARMRDLANDIAVYYQTDLEQMKAAGMRINELRPVFNKHVCSFLSLFSLMT